MTQLDKNIIEEGYINLDINDNSVGTTRCQVYVARDVYTKDIIRIFETKEEAESYFGANSPKVCIEKMWLEVERVLHG